METRSHLYLTADGRKGQTPFAGRLPNNEAHGARISQHRGHTKTHHRRLDATRTSAYVSVMSSVNRAVQLFTFGGFSIFVAVACSANESPEVGDASNEGSSSSDASSVFVPDPACELFDTIDQKRCPGWTCNCGNNDISSHAICLPGDEACRRVCAARAGSVVGPVECVPARDAAPPTDAARPSGKPGGQCIPPRNECFVTSCTCKNGVSRIGRHPVPCVGGVCGTLAQGCEPVCADAGGWSGEGY